MKNKFFKIVTMFTIVMLSASIFVYKSNAEELVNTSWSNNTKPLFICRHEIIEELNEKYLAEDDENPDDYPRYIKKLLVTDKMVNDKDAIPVKVFGNGTLVNNVANAVDVSFLSQMYAKFYKDSEILGSIAQDILESRSDNATVANYRITVDKNSVDPAIAQDAVFYSNDYNSAADFTGILADLSQSVDTSVKLKVKFDAIMSNGEEYTMVIADGETYEYDVFMVRTIKLVASENDGPEETDPKQPDDEPTASTVNLTYTAVVDNKEVKGEVKENIFYPSFDKDNSKKDADVIAKLESSNSEISKINNVALNADGTANNLGWYYINKDDKKIIAKTYKFDDYNNSTNNGVVSEKGLIVTFSDDTTDTKDVQIKWPFRIISITKTPETVNEKTDKVKVVIVTNLPIDKEKLPTGWKFTDDDLGKSQHSIYFEYVKSDKNVDDTVELKANNRDDKDSAKIQIEWVSENNDEKLPAETPNTGSNSYLLVIAAIASLGVGIVVIKKFRKMK